MHKNSLTRIKHNGQTYKNSEKSGEIATLDKRIINVEEEQREDNDSNLVKQVDLKELQH